MSRLELENKQKQNFETTGHRLDVEYFICDSLFLDMLDNVWDLKYAIMPLRLAHSTHKIMTKTTQLQTIQFNKNQRIIWIFLQGIQ